MDNTILFHIECVSCGHVLEDFTTWFNANQMCPNCGSKHAEVKYQTSYAKLKDIFLDTPQSFWAYFDYLPLKNKKNIISCNEGAIPLERWKFLEDYAKKTYDKNLEIWIYRNDLNGGTGTFKDVAASLAASIFKEEGIDQYTVASTGNTATAYARYLAMAGVNFSVFIPNNALQASEAEISSYGQQVYRAQGDYSFAKKLAAEYANKNKILISAGNIDPLRVEAKKTMVFEWLRQLKKMPDVYIQAISGGTGPIAIDKAVRDLRGSEFEVENPRYIMVQSDGCDPMVQAWEQAKANNFPNGYETKYPIIDNPDTVIPTLATGDPKMYPIISKLIHKSGGDFVRMKESSLIAIARLIAYYRKVQLGPASAVCMGGFFESLKQGLINSGETVIVNTGEGVRRAPDFMNEMIYTTKNIQSSSECVPQKMQNWERKLWTDIENLL
jgi:threonine synthase